MNRKISLPYGDKEIYIRLPEKNLSWVVTPKEAVHIENEAEEIRRAIRSPIGTSPLPELVKQNGKNVVLLVDDNTRSTPQKRILPILLEELNKAGVNDNNITGLIALGTHRAMENWEIRRRFGEEIVNRIRFVNHDWQNLESLVKIESSQVPYPAYINHLYYKADISIGIGNIIPHMYTGWAGGAKIVQPGVCGEETTGETHIRAGENVYNIIGNLDNIVRKQINAIARASGLTMIVNTVLNNRGEIAKVVAGDFELAHKEGVKFAEKVYCFNIAEQQDIIIASSHPADRDFWQSVKALNNCGMAVKDRGTLILLCPDPEGIAPDHPDFISLGTCSPQEAKERFKEGKIKDKVALATYLAMDVTRRRINIILVSEGIDLDEASKIGLKLFDDIDNALDIILRQKGEDAKVGVVTHGGDVMFKIDKLK
jgi:nickel-dependent lactate racemase